jgi:hypothetical protein
VAFLSWYLLVESPADTGLAETRSVAELQTTLTEAHDFLLPSGEASDDPEALYVFGVVMQVDPYIRFENQKEWIRPERELPHRLPPQVSERHRPAPLRGPGRVRPLLPRPRRPEERLLAVPGPPPEPWAVDPLPWEPPSLAPGPLPAR